MMPNVLCPTCRQYTEAGKPCPKCAPYSAGDPKPRPKVVPIKLAHWPEYRKVVETEYCDADEPEVWTRAQ